MLLFAACPLLLFAQTKRVLFIGNSYTDVNNLPEMVKAMALSTGDQLFVQSVTPGGTTFRQHSTYQPTLAAIATGGWDYVVLQEQSQLPSFPTSQVATEMYPFAAALDSIIKVSNPCAKTMFYMTWGRKNGDAANCGFFPPLCTYQGMDSLIRLRYTTVANDNSALISPVGPVWRYVRNIFPSIELYSSDESHPSLAGTFAAGAAFYATLLQKDPNLISYNPGISVAEANNLKAAAKAVAFDSLGFWNAADNAPLANFSLSNPLGSNTVSFTNSSLNSNAYNWYFGDGGTSTLANPTYTYANAGNYTVKLIAKKCLQEDSTTRQVTVTTSAVSTLANNEVGFSLYPNPAGSHLNLKMQTAPTDLRYEIMDSRSAVIKNGMLQAKQSTIDISLLPAGMYFIILSIDGEVLGRQKFVKS